VGKLLAKIARSGFAVWIWTKNPIDKILAFGHPMKIFSIKLFHVRRFRVPDAIFYSFLGHWIILDQDIKKYR
jgi:hypothetical protein